MGHIGLIEENLERKKKHIPQRTCVGCRQVQAKRSLTRIVCTVDGVFVDISGKLSGRGAYLHDNRSCWEQGFKGSLARALKVELTSDDIERLKHYILELPE